MDSVGPGMGFPGLVQEKDVNPASTAFTTMISQASHPPLPVHQLYECNGGADLKQILLTHTRLKAPMRTSTLSSTSTSSTKINVIIYFTNCAFVWLEQMPTPLQSLITMTFFTSNSAGNNCLESLVTIDKMYYLQSSQRIRHLSIFTHYKEQ